LLCITAVLLSVTVQDVDVYVIVSCTSHAASWLYCYCLICFVPPGCNNRQQKLVWKLLMSSWRHLNGNTKYLSSGLLRYSDLDNGLSSELLFAVSANSATLTCKLAETKCE